MSCKNARKKCLQNYFKVSADVLTRRVSSTNYLWQQRYQVKFVKLWEHLFLPEFVIILYSFLKIIIFARRPHNNVASFSFQNVKLTLNLHMTKDFPGHLISTRPWISLLQGSDTNPSGDAASQDTFKVIHFYKQTHIIFYL